MADAAGPTIVVVGLRHGARHATAFASRMSGNGTVAVCDLSPDRVAEVTRSGRASSFPSWADIPENAALTVISLPNHLHAPALAAFSAKTNGLLLCEKPLLRDPGEATAIPPAQRHRVQTICELRLNDCAARLRDLIQHSGLSSLRLSWRRNSVPATAWYADPGKSGGGAIIDLGVHLLDFLQFLTGDGFARVSVVEAALQFEPGIAVEVAGTALLRVDDCPVYLDVGWRGGQPGREIGISLETRDGRRYVYTSRTGSHRLLRDADGEGGYRDWYSLFLSGQPLPFPAFEHSLAVSRLIEALYRAALS
jgi:predicted dehydrogenase